MRLSTIMGVVAALVIGVAGAANASELTKDFESGKPDIKAMSLLEFGPDGLLFIGDSKSGAVFAVETGDLEFAGDNLERFAILDLEQKIAAMLGTTPEEVLIHDMAVNPLSLNTYVAVSRGRTGWNSRWLFPNDLADASILLRIGTDKSITEFPLTDVRFAKADLPNPVDLNKEHRWKKGVKVRADAMSGLVYADGKLYISGLSSEEFSSAMWQMDFPFDGKSAWTTLEIFHGAHGEYETHAPIRAFVPFELSGQPSILAAYLCTPLVTFPIGDLADGTHIKGKTISELGSGNYPIDMVAAEWDGKRFIVISHSMLPLMTIDIAEIEKYNDMPGITTEPDTYLAGASYTPRSGNGVQHMDNFGERGILALQRMPSGKLDMIAMSVERLAF